MSLVIGSRVLFPVAVSNLYSSSGMGGGPPTALGLLLNVAIIVIEYNFASEMAGTTKYMPMVTICFRKPTNKTTLATEAVAEIECEFQDYKT